MKRTLLIITMAAQLAATAPMAQTADTSTTASTAAGTTTGTFGSDWSASMGTAMMGNDGISLRSADEITTQFDTMSDMDKDMLRRDCMMYMQTSGAADTSTTTDATAGTAQTDATGQTTVEGDASATAGTDGAAKLSLTSEQMEQICAATKDK